MVGTCRDMCPQEERIRRLHESDVHKLEMLSAAQEAEGLDLRSTMIKKLQRSSADHELKIPHLMRTPRCVLTAYPFDILKSFAEFSSTLCTT